MYIFKNALRCIGRSKGRNVLIGIIALVIAVSACLGLSIRQAAQSAQEDALAGMSVTATISYDRSGAMNDMMSGGFPGGSFDKNQFADMMGSGTSLTLEQYKTYAEAESVKDFYYTLTAYFNGSENLSPVSDEAEQEEDTSEDSSEDSSADSGSSAYSDMGGMPGGMPDMGGSMPSFGGFQGFDNEFMNQMVGGAADYVTEVDSAMNLTVVLQMIGIGLLLTLFASGVSVLFVMRYDPLKILSNRD